MYLGELFREIFLGAESPWGNCLAESFIGDNCLGGSCPWGNYSVVIVCGRNVRRVIFLGTISWGLIGRGECIQGGIIQWQLSEGQKFVG